ncbi:MAG: hypothetical protein N2440_01535 [Actinobacteria bacterium]|nr:hypothetical protein [Actinomycetota bacterium]
MFLRSKKLLAATLLVALSALLYVIHFLIFKDAHHIFLFLLHELAFLPLEVLIVAMVLERVLEQITSEERSARKKMILGSVFSEFGNELLHILSKKADKDFVSQFTDEFLNEMFSAPPKQFEKMSEELIKPTRLDLTRSDFVELKEFLLEKRNFLLSIIENPSLTEEESFTETAFSIMHLSDELSYRKDLNKIGDTDLEHLRGDTLRILFNLTKEWLDYMRFIKNRYPYLFSLSVRANPFAEQRSIEID